LLRIFPSCNKFSSAFFSYKQNIGKNIRTMRLYSSGICKSKPRAPLSTKSLIPLYSLHGGGKRGRHRPPPSPVGLPLLQHRIHLHNDFTNLRRCAVGDVKPVIYFL
jgi:hypothetical protein